MTGPSVVRSFPVAVVLVLTAVWTTGCDAEAGSTLGGGPIRLQQLPERTPVERFRLGGAEAPLPELFRRPPPLAVRPVDGSLYVLARGDGEVRVFSPEGEHLHDVSRRGEGPGELQIARDLGFVGDTLWVTEIEPPRVTWFAPDGEHLRTDAEQDPVIGRTGVPQVPRAMLRGGHRLVEAEVPFGAGRERVEVPVYLEEIATESRDTVGFRPDPVSLRIPGVGSFGRVRLFPRPTLYAVEPAGGGVVVAEWGDDDPGAVRLRRYAPDGSVTLDRSLDVDPTPVPRDVRDSIVQAGVEAVTSAVGRLPADREVPTDLEAAVREDLALPESYPPIRSVLAGVDGTVWVERMTSPSEGVWIALSSEGSPLFRLTLPSGVRLRAASADAAWAVFTDELEVPYVIRYDLRE